MGFLFPVFLFYYNNFQRNSIIKAKNITSRLFITWDRNDTSPNQEDTTLTLVNTTAMDTGYYGCTIIEMQYHPTLFSIVPTPSENLKTLNIQQYVYVYG